MFRNKNKIMVHVPPVFTIILVKCFGLPTTLIKEMKSKKVPYLKCYLCTGDIIAYSIS